MTWMRRHAVVAGLAVAALALAMGKQATRAADGPLRGVWTAEPSHWKTTDGGSATVIQLLLRRTGAGHDWNSSFPVLLGDLKGLTAAATRSPHTDVRFEMV